MFAAIPKFLSFRILLTAAWFAALLLTAVGPAAAAPAPSPGPAPVLAPMAPAYDLAPYMEILFDPSQELTIQQVSSHDFDSRFRRTSPRPTLKLGITASAVWLRFKLHRPHTPPAKGLPPRPGGRFIEMDNTQIQFLDAYFPLAMAVGGRGQPIFQVVQTGISRPPGQRPILFRTFVIPVPAGYLDGRYIYLRLLSANTLTVRPYLYSQNGLQRRLANDSYFFGVVFGVLLAMLLINLIFFFAFWDRTYLYYVFYVASMFMFALVTYGQINLLLSLPPRIGQGIIWFFVGLVIISAAIFTRAFLRTKLRTPRLDKALLVMAGTGGLAILGALTGYYRFASVLTHLLSLIEPCLIIATALICWRRGFQPARFFLLAWFLLLATVFMMGLKGFGLLPQALSATETLPAATALEAVLLSFALADRIRLLRKEREEAQRGEMRYRQMSITDELTGLYNKRFLSSRLVSEVEHAQNVGQPLTMLLLDVDDFKLFNDTHGHSEGDKVLAGLARIIRESSRESDFACRYGGEEFVVIMPGTLLEQGHLLSERIRTGFYDMPFHPLQGSAVHVAVSIGLAQLRPGEDSDSLLRRSDQALYQAKRAGKNQTVASTSP
jgi:two-component system, sensor histidine kinase LadS